ncbi:hypothetical protein [Anaerococcus obesiensis]|uniref:hypothetical protein n=1 Tax=Anaerococcus obesiensis TaxID=1287640 RepID=UPI003991FA5D
MHEIKKKDGTLEHLICLESTRHSVWYDINGFHCNEPNCEINNKQIHRKVELNKQETINLNNRLNELEDYTEFEIKNKHTIIDENLKVKNENKEEIKQLKAQLRIELKKELDSKYGQILKDNYKLIIELRNAKSSLVAIMDQYDKMKNNNIKLLDDVTDELKSTDNALSILKILITELK